MAQSTVEQVTEQLPEIVKNLDETFKLDNFLTKTEILNNSLLQWIIAIAIFFVVFIVLRILRNIIRNRWSKIAQKTNTKLDNAAVDLLSSTRTFFFIAISFFAATLALHIAKTPLTIIGKVVSFALLAQLFIWGNQLITSLINLYMSKEKIDSSTRTTLSAINFISRLVLYSLLFLFALDNLGVDINALVAGIGIGSVAIALAVQNILSDLFSSLSIVLDKPFEIGDYIVVGDFSGTIENIGLRSTRLRSLTGEQLIFSNQDLLGSRIRNYKRMTQRRSSFSIGVTYDTTPEQLRKIPQIIKKAIEGHAHTRFDRSHFSSFGDSALIFDTVFYMSKTDYALFKDTQQEINLEILTEFAKEGIEFAFPTQTILLEGLKKGQLE